MTLFEKVKVSGELGQLQVTSVREALGKVEVNLANARLELQGTAESKKWVNWLDSFGDEVKNADSLSPDKKKEYISGLVERIDVKYDADNREHHMTLKFYLPIVKDGIKYKGQGDEARTYEVINGSDTTTVVTKKKDGRG